MRKSFTDFLLLCIVVCSAMLFSAIIFSGCAQIGAPTGGSRDTLPPKLIASTPRIEAINVTGNKITLSFDEYVELKDVQNNVLVSPLQKNMPSIDYKLRTVTVKLKDTLLRNTTYSINFGNAIVDINESNAFKDFTYVFSTGPTVDSLSFSGNVLIAETGKADSTMVAMLYRNTDDSAVRKRKPDYISRVDGSGNFTFHHLPSGTFKLYAILDGDGSKTYNSKFETFAFNDNDVEVGASNPVQHLLAYAEVKEVKSTSQTTLRPTAADKKLKYSTSLAGGAQDLLSDIIITYSKPLKIFDSSKIILSDTNYNKVGGIEIKLDSSEKNVVVKKKWPEWQPYMLIINKEAATDSADNIIAKSDTIRFTTKKAEDYGRVVLRFNNLDLTKHPVLQLVYNDQIKKSYPLTSKEWIEKLFEPGEYELRILYDDNQNGKWDPGNYSLKKQPEKVVTLSQKLNVKSNWDNERDVNL